MPQTLVLVSKWLQLASTQALVYQWAARVVGHATINKWLRPRQWLNAIYDILKELLKGLKAGLWLAYQHACMHRFREVTNS